MKKILIVVAVLLVALVLAGGLAVYLRPIAIISALRRHDLVKSGFAKATIDSPVGGQRVFVAGSGPALLFLHGAGDDAGTWKDVAPKFTAKYRVVLVDLAGHGESAPLSGPLEMHALIEGLDAIVAKQDGPVILVGNSLGAWVAMLYAKAHPERVVRVVAVDGGPLKGDRIDLAKLPENREDARKVWDAIQDPGSPKMPDFILDDVVRQSHKGPIGRMDRADMEQHLATEESLRGFPVPVDMIWGRADRLVPVDYAERMIAALRLPQPGSQASADFARGGVEVRMVVLDRCGHIPQQECPIRFSQELQGSLSQQVIPAVKDAAIKEK